MSVSGLCYYVLFVDNFAKMSFVYQIKQPSELFSVIHKFYFFMNTQFDCKIQALLPNHGGNIGKIVFINFSNVMVFIIFLVVAHPKKVELLSGRIIIL